jgi:S1-C subfamily serine protease
MQGAAMSSYNRYPPRSQSSVVLWPLLLLLVLAVILVWRFWPAREHLADATAQLRPVTQRGPLAADELANIELFRLAAPSVAHIITTSAPAQSFFTQEVVTKGVGSGFVWDKKGHIVTNYHVIEGAAVADVTLADNSTWKARLVGADRDRDLAVLLIDAPPAKLHPILIGESHNLQVGQKVYAIGDPFGLDQTLTTGVVSALGRKVDAEDGRSLRGAIQTDAPINPGNSGGPLLDSAGRLIGVNSAILSPSKASAGIGFAIPVDDVNRIVTQLIRYRKVIRPGLGIEEAADQVTKRLGLEGVLILSIYPKGPAAKANLRGTRRARFGQLLLGDVIVIIDGQKVASTQDLFALLEKHEVGDTVQVGVLRQRLDPDTGRPLLDEDSGRPLWDALPPKALVLQAESS